MEGFISVFHVAARDHDESFSFFRLPNLNSWVYWKLIRLQALISLSKMSSEKEKKIFKERSLLI